MEETPSSGSDRNRDQQCGFYLTKKKRRCKMTVGKGRSFCGEHEHISHNLANTEVDSTRRRIPCPLDPTHSCFENMLPKHLKKCNKTKQMDQDYYAQESYLNKETNIKKLPISELTDEQLLMFIDKITKIYNEKVKAMDPRNVEFLAKGIFNQNYKHDLKHKTQVASIIGHIENFGLLKPNTCFIEFGAGRGELTSALVQATGMLQKCSYLLIDRASQRHKYDAKLRHDRSVDIRRIRIDIGNLVVDKLDEVRECENVVIISKHLCGGATDLALRRVALMSESTATKKMAIALCCHHRCSLETYVGWTFLSDFGLEEFEFSVLTGISSWATCGQMPESAKNKRQSQEIDQDDGGNLEYSSVLDSKTPQNRYEKLGLTCEKRKGIGFMAKRIIDAGRIKFMQSRGFNACSLKKYVDDDVTLENVLLLCS